MRWSTVKQGELFCQLHNPAVQIPEDRMQQVRVMLADLIIGILGMREAKGTSTDHGEEGSNE